MDLEILKLGIKEREVLKSSGVKSVEALALSDPDELPFGKQKSASLVQTARSIVAARAIEKVIISEKGAEVRCKQFDQVAEKSVKSVLNLEEYYNEIVVKGNIIRVWPREGHEASWKAWILPQLQKWKFRIESSTNQTLKDKGITLNVSEIRDFAQKNGFDGFWKEVFADIKGAESMKEALAAALFSTFDEPVHLAIIGPPASAKTLARDIIAQNFSEVQTIGANVTRAGLVINYATGEKGAIADADNMIVLADEFDKVPARDAEFMYELMSNGTCSVHSGNIHMIIRSKFTLIATMNPEEQVFSDAPLEDIGLSPTLTSRFALVIKAGELEKTERMELLREKFYRGSKLSKFSEYYDQWVKLARLHSPEITASENSVDDFILKIDRIIEDFKNTPLRRDLRMGDYARRIPFSIARSEFRDVDEEVLERAWNIVTRSIQDWKTFS